MYGYETGSEETEEAQKGLQERSIIGHGAL